MNIKDREKIKVSARYVVLLLCIVAVVSFLILFFIGEKSMFQKLTITFRIISGCLFLFLFFGLYKGIGIKEENLDVGGFAKKKMSLSKADFWDFADTVVDFDCLEGDGIFITILAIIAWLLMSILLGILLTFVWGALISLFVMIYWLFYRALKKVFDKGEYCNGDLARSLIVALIYTVLYTGWGYLIVACFSKNLV